MNTVKDLTLAVEDLAGRWTEPALEMLTAAGIGPVSVDLEVETWQILKKLLRHIMVGDNSHGTAAPRTWNAGVTGNASEFAGPPTRHERW